MIRIIPFKTGSKGNCVWVDDGNVGILLDAGINGKFVRDQLREKGLLEMLQVVIISHEHTDHNLHVKFWEDRGVRTIRPKEIQDNYMVETHRAFGLGIPPNHVRLDPYKLHHDVPNFGWLIQFFGSKESVFWATDTSKLPAGVKIQQELFDCTIYIVESNNDETMATIDDEGYMTRGFSVHMSKQGTHDWLMNHIGENTKHIHYIHLSTKIPDYHSVVKPLNKEGITETYFSPEDMVTEPIIINPNPFKLALEKVGR